MSATLEPDGANLAAPPNKVAWLTPERVAAYAGGALILQLMLVSLWVWRVSILTLPDVPLPGIDFAVFWSGAVLALNHGVAAVFDNASIKAIEELVHPTGYWGPWLYPPTFLLVIYPFGLLPYTAALVLFTVIGVGAYGFSIATIARPFGKHAILPALAFPGLFLAVCYGQNSLLTMASAGMALALLPRRPVLAGACIAILGIKPQLGILFPIALVCGRHWRAFASAAICSVIFWATSVATLGMESLTGFFAAVTEFSQTWIEQIHRIFMMVPTTYGVARWIGLQKWDAYFVHALVAGPAAAVTAWLWGREARFELKASALCVATVLVQPYLVHYDLAWLGLPIAFLAVDMKKHGTRSWEIVLLISTWLVPFQAFATTLPSLASGQWAPIVSVALLALILRRNIRGVEAAAQPLQTDKSNLRGPSQSS